MPWTLPAVVVLIIAAFRGGGTSLADVALHESVRRALMPASAHSLTMSDIPPAPPAEPRAEPPEPPAKAPELPAKAPEPPAKSPELDEAGWRKRMAAARAALEQDQVLADAMQSHVNSLTNDSLNRDDPAQRAELLKQRDRALDELERLTKQIEKDKLAITAVEDDARKKGIPPGWIRDGGLGDWVTG